MTNRLVTVLIALVLFGSFSCSCFSMTPEEASTLLLSALDYRMQPMKCRCEVTLEGFIAEDQNRYDYREKWHVRMDRGRVRVDPLPISWKARLARQAVMCIGCYDSKTVSYYSIEHPNSALSVYGIEKAGQLFMLDPRKIGLSTSELSGNQIGLRKFFTQDPKDIKTSVTENGDIKIVAERGFGYVISFELRAYDGTYLPSRIAFEYPMDGVQHVQTVQSQYVYFDGHWLISSSLLEGYAGEHKKFEEKCEVISLPFENPDEVFSIASMGVPKGTVVSWGTEMQPPGDPGALYFDGEKITSVSLQGSVPGFSWFVGFNGLLIVVGALIFIWQWKLGRSKVV